MTRIEASFSGANDADLYEIEVQKACTVTISTDTLVDPYLALFNPDGSQVTFSQDDGFPTTADGNDTNESRIVWPLQPGTYFLGISIEPVYPSGSDTWSGSGNLTYTYPSPYAINFQGDCFNGDADNDGFKDADDNCPADANPGQTDTDGDGQGDACDVDDDNDTIGDGSDNCVLVANTDQANNDGDAEGDACDVDDDNDGIADAADNCAFVANAAQTNSDGDSQGDACDDDDDNDSVVDGTDNCHFVANTNQLDTDADHQGDACDSDDDADGYADDVDNCPLAANPNQRDSDGDGAGDACDGEFNSTAGKATGGGTVPNAAFSVSAKNDAAAIGTCQVVVGKTKIKCLDVDGYFQSPTGDRVVLVGDATVDGTATRYRIELEDHGEPGSNDSFAFQTDAGPHAEGLLRGGNVQIHKP